MRLSLQLVAVRLVLPKLVVTNYINHEGQLFCEPVWLSLDRAQHACTFAVCLTEKCCTMHNPLQHNQKHCAAYLSLALT